MISIEFISPEGEELNEYNHLLPWLNSSLQELGTQNATVVYVMGGDDWLLGINQEHLKHDFYTDVITFDLSESDHEIVSDVCISTERIAENATNNNNTYQEELRRVLIHAILHLHGYDDQTPEDKNIMRKQENKYLNVSRGT